MKNGKGKIVTITSCKGGVGKSTFLLNLAGIYRRMEKKVLLIDFDLSGGSLALSLNVRVSKTIYHFIEDLMFNRYKNFEDYVIHAKNGMDILSCPKDPRQTTKLDLGFLPVLFDTVCRDYDVILIDTSHGFSKLNVSIYDASDTIVYMFTNNFMDLKNSKNFMGIMKDAEKENVRVVLNESLPGEKYFNHFDMRTMIGANIDYTITSASYIKNMTSYFLEGQVVTLENIWKDKKYQKEDKKYLLMAKDFIKEE